MSTRPFGLGLVGAGSFGRFCLNAFQKLPDLRLAAIYDIDSERARETAAAFGMKATPDVDGMLSDPAVDIVAINTPPASHAGLSKAALRAGKHVFCEKPLATSLADAADVLHLAEGSGLSFSVDYIMRANPLYRLVKQLGELQVEGKPVFGRLRRCAFENFAADEDLGPDHWFWDPGVSGGIFVEHGVHFFDLFGWQIGSLPEKVIALTKTRDGKLLDTAQAIIGYAGGATSSSFHAFTHAKAGEFQAVIFGWDWAVAELHGWIALDLRLEALLDDAGLALFSRALAEGERLLRVPGEPLIGGTKLNWRIEDQYPTGRIMKGHGQERPITARVVVEASLGGPEAKPIVYEQSVRQRLAAQLNAIQNDSSWTIPPADLWTSTAAAVSARESAASGQVVQIPGRPPPSR